MLVGDCLGGVRACHRGQGAHLRKSMFGGLLRQAFLEPRAAAAVASMEKVKAHQDLTELNDGSLAHRRASGNEQADKAANRGRSMHAAASLAAWAMCELDFADALVTSKLAARALARWPTSLPRVEVSATHRLEQRTAAAGRLRARQLARRAVLQKRADCIQSHEWAWWNGVEKCNVCLISRARGGRQRCTGEPTKLWLKAAEASGNGHDIWLGEAVRIRGHDPIDPLHCLQRLRWLGPNWAGEGRPGKTGPPLPACHRCRRSAWVQPRQSWPASPGG